jgi:hypothetical protein
MMKNKSKKAKFRPTLIRGEMIPITDPAEQAELDRRCEEAEKMFAAQAAEAARKGKPRRRK